jgi:hypothetical protein
MMVTPEPAPSGLSRPIAMAFMIWEGTYGNGVKTGPMLAGTAGYFGALPGSTNIPMICCCRIAATIRLPAAGIITGSGACSGNGRDELPLVRRPFLDDIRTERGRAGVRSLPWLLTGSGLRAKLGPLWPGLA